MATGSRRLNFSISFTLVGFRYNITAIQWMAFSIEASSVKGIVYVRSKPKSVQRIMVSESSFLIDSIYKGASESVRLQVIALWDRQADSMQLAIKASSPS